MVNGTTHPTISPLLSNSTHLPKQNGYSDFHSTLPTTNIPNSSPRIPPGISPPTMNRTPPPPQPQPSSFMPSSNDLPAVKPLMADTCNNGATDLFDEFRRMAAQIHQQFNAPYSKVINAASSPSPPISTTDGVQTNGATDKNARPLSNISQNKSLPTSTFAKSWKVEHTAGTFILLLLLLVILFSPHIFSSKLSMHDTLSNTESLCC